MNDVQYQQSRKDVAERLARLGYNTTDKSLQWEWRTKPDGKKADYQEIVAMILECLIHQGGIFAWDGDGVGCLAQAILAQVQRAEKAEAEVASLKATLA